MLGLSFDNELDDALIVDTREQPGGLPLLSYTLEALWTEMQERNKRGNGHGAYLGWG